MTQFLEVRFAFSLRYLAEFPSNMRKQSSRNGFRRLFSGIFFLPLINIFQVNILNKTTYLEPNINNITNVQLRYSECKQTESLLCDKGNRCGSLKYSAC